MDYEPLKTYTFNKTAIEIINGSKKLCLKKLIFYVKLKNFLLIIF